MDPPNIARPAGEILDEVEKAVVGQTPPARTPPGGHPLAGGHVLPRTAPGSARPSLLARVLWPNLPAHIPPPTCCRAT